MSGRGAQILGRFPAHLEAARPGKLLGVVVDALARDQDTLAAALAAVRRAHRLSDADELSDLWRLAALHGLAASDFEIILQRRRRARELLAILEASTDSAARELAADALAALWALPASTSSLQQFADPAAPADSAAAAARMAVRVRETLREAALTDAVRTRIAHTSEIHASGNGTVLALLRAAANVLDIDLGEVQHSADRYWHAARVVDRLRLARLEQNADGGSTLHELPVAEEVLGIEENPLWRADTDHTPRAHGELFTLLRRGFERALLQVHVTGEGERTVFPMLVNRDEGHGIGYAGIVANGQELVFTEEGRVLLAGTDVTTHAFVWQGACFAGDDASSEVDFVFTGEGLDPRRKPARLVTMAPLQALDREAAFPSDGASLPMPGIAVGLTRLAFFVREAHFAAEHGTPSVLRSVTPLTGAAIFDAAVAAPPPLPRAPAARVALSWQEHRAFAVRLLVPPRFRAWRADDGEGALTLQAIARALERHRPVGVEVRVEFIDDRWRLGSGTLSSGIGDDPIELLRSGMVLWSAPAEPVA